MRYTECRDNTWVLLILHGKLCDLNVIQMSESDLALYVFYMLV